MNIETARVIEHLPVTDAYKMLAIYAPATASAAKPGQFLHMLVPRLEGSVLRRPFSIFSAEGDIVSIIYKKVGRGTAAMTTLAARDHVSIIGPLGNGFPLDLDGRFPLLVAGGYGVAPLCFLAGKLAVRGALYIGAKNRSDLLCVDKFLKSGWKVRIATEDGSAGQRGMVTDLLGSWREETNGADPELFVCGPDGMMKAVADIAVRNNWKTWLSLDKHMGCGIGACLACVQRIRNADGQESWKRVCRDGPIFEAREVVWKGKDQE